MSEEPKEEGPQSDVRNYEEVLVQLEKQPWPPRVRWSEDEDYMNLTELDVTWMFCSILGMKWRDAKEVEGIDRKFLYMKSLQISELKAEQEAATIAKQKELEEKYQTQLAYMQQQQNQWGGGNQVPVTQSPDPAWQAPRPEELNM